MRHTIKAVLLSALVFPGTGHFSLKKPVQGTILVLITLVCLYFLFSTAVDLSNDFGSKIQTGQMDYDPEKLKELVTDKLTNGDYQYLRIAGLVFMACWIFGVFDSLRIGRIKDTTNENHKSF